VISGSRAAKFRRTIATNRGCVSAGSRITGGSVVSLSASAEFVECGMDLLPQDRCDFMPTFAAHLAGIASSLARAVAIIDAHAALTWSSGTSSPSILRRCISAIAALLLASRACPRQSCRRRRGGIIAHIIRVQSVAPFECCLDRAKLPPGRRAILAWLIGCQALKSRLDSPPVAPQELGGGAVSCQLVVVVSHGRDHRLVHVV